VVMHSRPVPGSNFKLYRGSKKVKGNPRKLCLADANADEAMMKFFDKNTLEWKEVEVLDKDTKVMYILQDLPWPVWDRDVVFVQKIIEEDNKLYQIIKSVEHPKAPELPKKYVRCKVHITGYVFEPAEPGEKLDTATSTICTRIVHADPMGSIPAWVVEMQAKDQVVTVINNLERMRDKLNI